jgi:hypothetical protein
MELFTAFLFLAESVVVFVSILFLFYLNVYNYVNSVNKQYYSYKYITFFSITIIYSLSYCLPYEAESLVFFNSDTVNLWDDYYESLNNYILTDLFGLFLSFYYFNSFEFLLIGMLLLVGSLVSVNLHKITRLNRVKFYGDFLLMFDFFKDFSKFIFMRKQNLVDQENHISSTRVFKKK